jgi:hypothetical protein
VPAPDSGKIYKPGDSGPAGGIVFYDKGVFSHGWRYLEAAPTETEFTASWGLNGKEINGTVTAIGGGKRNTQIINEQLRQTGETGKAAQLCEAINFDGVTGWYLPSKDELDLLYKNLKVKGIGGFTNNRYASSSNDGRNIIWVQSFNNGRQYSLEKNTSYSVRAIRAF